MTVAAQTVLVNLVAGVGQTVFPFAFRVDDSATLAVYVADALQPGGNYVIFLNVNQTTTPGGTITFGVAPATGAIVSIERASPIQQSTGFTTYLAFPSATVSNILDKVVMLLQEVWASLNRAVKHSRGNISLISTTALPVPVLGALIGWVSTGGGLFALGNISGVASGELLTDSGDHTHFTSINSPVGNGALYRNGQRIFAPDDYSVAGNTWTLVTPVNPSLGEKLNADYSHT